MIGAPCYFRRVYDRRNAEPQTRRGGIVCVDPLAGHRLVIYGRAAPSTHPDDRVLEAEAWERGRRFQAECFSPLAPEGELGFVRLVDVAEITEAEFEAARGAGWPQ